jgi:hypothetical protein
MEAGGTIPPNGFTSPVHARMDVQIQVKTPVEDFHNKSWMYDFYAFVSFFIAVFQLQKYIKKTVFPSWQNKSQ